MPSDYKCAWGISRPLESHYRAIYDRSDYICVRGVTSRSRPLESHYIVGLYMIGRTIYVCAEVGIGVLPSHISL